MCLAAITLTTTITCITRHHHNHLNWSCYVYVLFNTTGHNRTNRHDNIALYQVSISSVRVAMCLCFYRVCASCMLWLRVCFGLCICVSYLNCSLQRHVGLKSVCWHCNHTQTAKSLFSPCEDSFYPVRCETVSYGWVMWKLLSSQLTITKHFYIHSAYYS